MASLSVIIPAYNSAETIPLTLEALAAQKGAQPDEIIVVDSSEGSKTRDALKSFESDRVKIISLGQKTIPAVARNIGAERASGDLLVFMDADAYPAPDCLDTIRESYRAGMALGGGAIALPTFQRNRPIPVAQYFLQFNEFMDSGRVRVKAFVPSCLLFCGRELFKKIGGFPDIRAAEDVLFGLKAKNLSDVYFVPEAKIYHVFREKARDFFANQKLLGRYVLIYRRKTSLRFIYKKYWPIFFLPAFLAVKLARITGRVMASGRPGLIGRYLLFSPYFLAGLVYWCAGFIEGALGNE